MLLGAVVLCGLGAVATLTPQPAAAADPRLELVSQPAYVTTGGSATLLLDIPSDRLPAGEAVVVRLRLYSRVTTTETFERSISGERLSGRLTTRRLPLAELPRDATGSVSVTFGVGDSPVEPTVAASRPGVYPLEVALESGDTLTSFVTWLVVVADPAAEAEAVAAPLRVAWTWSTVAAPARGVDGASYPDVAAEFAAGGRLDGVSSVLASAAALPMSLVAGPETLEAWNVLAQTDPTVAPALGRVTTAAARPTTQLLPTPYVPIDLTALEAAGLGDELPNQIVVGSDTLEQQTGIRPEPRTAFVDPVDGPVLARLRRLLVDRVVVREDQLTPTETPSLQTFVLNAGDGEIRAAVTTTLVDSMLAGSDPPALRVQRALTALSVVAFEDTEAVRGVVIAPPEQVEVEVYSALVTAMRSHPLLAPVTLDDFFEQVPNEAGDDRPVARELAATEPGGFPVTGADYVDAKSALAALESSIDPTSPGFDQGERALLLALSTAQSSETAAEQLAVIDAGVQQLNAGITTTRKRVTLTSRKADVPLSFRNDTGRPVRVRVNLDSTKLLFPDGDEFVLDLPEGNSVERFAVEARTSGTFTMTVTLTTEDGRLPIGAPTRVTVRSAVFSGVGAALTVGALIFLALWWGNHFRKARRARAAIETV